MDFKEIQSLLSNIAQDVHYLKEEMKIRNSDTGVLENLG